VAFGSHWPDTRVTASTSTTPPGIYLAVDGVLDQEDSADFLVLASLALREARGLGALVIGLGGLKHISSMGVATLTNLLIEGRKLEVPVYLDGVTPSVKVLFDVLGFSSYFSFSRREDKE
jgi:anti-anti-sigma factor